MEYTEEQIAEAMQIHSCNRDEAISTWCAHIEAAKVETRAAARLHGLRFERNRRLAETDWWASSDLTMTAEQTAYRQALRDITETYTSLDDVVWPTKPTE